MKSSEFSVLIKNATRNKGFPVMRVTYCFFKHVNGQKLLALPL